MNDEILQKAQELAKTNEVGVMLFNNNLDETRIILPDGTFISFVYEFGYRPTEKLTIGMINYNKVASPIIKKN
jgi:hypothetical protein